MFYLLNAALFVGAYTLLYRWLHGKDRAYGKISLADRLIADRLRTFTHGSHGHRRELS